MPCNFVSLEGGGVAIVCGPGGYSHLVMAMCPWCCLGDETTVHAFREVFSGYCAPDLICGECGQYHTYDHGAALKLKDETREENKAKVQALRDAGVEVGPWPSPSALEDLDEPAERGL